MDTRAPAVAAPEPPDVPADRLYRYAPETYRGLVDHGLVDPRDVLLDDGLLVRAGQGGDLYRMPLDVYDEAVRVGVFDKNDRAVLLDGFLVKKMTKGARHTTAFHLVVEALRGITPGGWHVRFESPVRLPDPPNAGSEPEPDVSLVRGGIIDYLERHPDPADVALVVEVADSSLREDRDGLRRYARAGLPAAWVVNLVDDVVEVYSAPEADRYAARDDYRKGDAVPVVVDGREVGRAAVDDLIP